MSSLNVLWRMLAVDLRFGAREVAGRFGAEALQLHRVERPRAQRHRHRGGVREAAGHRGTPLPAKGPRRCKGPLPPQPLWPSMAPRRSARPVARGARRGGARRPRCEHAPRARRAPGVPGRLCLPERAPVQGERPRERARRPARRHARPGARSPGAMDRSPTFSTDPPRWG